MQRELENCKAFYQRELALYEYCRRHRRFGCRRPIEACSVPPFNRCTEQYDVCFLGCGGRIHNPKDSDISSGD
jgi:hypothetical protein